MNYIRTTASNLYSYAGDCVVSGKNTVVGTAAGAASVAVGGNNVANAVERLREPVAHKIVRLSNNRVAVKSYNPSIVERISSASSELTVAGAKVAGWTMFTHGGVCKAGAALGLMNPCGTFSVGGLTEAFFTGTTWVAGQLIQGAAFAGQNVSLPAAKFVGETVLSNPVDAAAAVGIGYSLYSAYQDVAELQKPLVYIVEGNSVTIDETTQKSYYQKTMLCAKAVGKVAVAGAITACAVKHHLSDNHIES